jgi:hypothetical protein
MHVSVLARTLLGQAFGRLLADGGYAWVEGLTLRGGGRTSGMLERLVPFLEGLTSLGMQNNHHGAHDTESLTRQPALATLAELHLVGNPIGVRGAASLGHSRHLARLTTLVVRGGSLTAKAVAAFVKGCRLERLRILDLSTPIFGGLQAMATLGDWPFPGRLQELRLAAANQGAESVRALAHSPLMASLTSLDLTSNSRIGPEGVQILAAAPGAAGLTTLELAYCRVGDEGAEAIAASPHLSGLRRLNLRANGITDRGARALLDSPHLARLAQLELERSRLTPDMAVTFHRRFGPAMS